MGVSLTGQSITEAFVQACTLHPGTFLRLAREDGTIEDMTRTRLLEMSLRCAAWCREQGLSPGDRAILCLENSPAWCAAYLGILMAGGVAVPVDAQSVAQDTAWYLEKSRARLVISSKPEMFADCLPEGCGLGSDLAGILEHPPLRLAERHTSQPGNLAALIFTSGTTGRPKAVMLTHANLLANVSQVEATGLMVPEENFLAVLPLHHAYPCMVNLLTPLLLGRRTTFVETLKPEAILGALKTAGVSILVLTPQYVGLFHRRILKRFEGLPLGVGRLLIKVLAATAGRTPDPLAPLRRMVRKAVGPSFRFFITGGAKCDPEIIDGMAALGIGVVEGYGLSETAPVVSFNRPDSGKVGSVGTPLPGVEVRIDNPDADGYGEICIRGPNVMPGYFENPEATAKAIRNGWFHSGDQGRMDPDGAIWVRGRERDIIVLPNGKKFPAEEVENHYRQAPSVAEVCVMQAGDGSLRAVVVPDKEFFKTADAPDIRHNIRWDFEVLARSLPPYKRISGFTVARAELPKTRLGKLKRHLVEAMLETGQQGDGPEDAWPEADGLGGQVLEAVRRVSGLENVSPGSHLELDLGLDSLKRLELLTLLEDALGRPVPEEPFQRLTTAGEVLEFSRSLEGGDAQTENIGASSPRATRQTVGALDAAALNAPLPPELVGKVRFTLNPLESAANRAVGALIDLTARVGYKLEVSGQEHLAGLEGRPAILCPNHASFLDGFMLLAALPHPVRMRLYFLGLARFFDSPVVRRLAGCFRLISVDAGRILETMRLSALVLKNDRLLCVFPEGARSPSGELLPFRKGPVVLSSELGVDVVPCGISGTHEAWPVGGRLRLGKTVRVRFGAPMRPKTPEELREAVRGLLV